MGKLINLSDNDYFLVASFSDLLSAETVEEAHLSIGKMYEIREQVEITLNSFFEKVQMALKEKIDNLVAQ